jgi:lysyl-tRNA synthetase class 2
VRELPGPAARRAAMHLVRTHGSDTLAFFKLRPDKHYLFSPDGRAFLGYRVVHGALLVSGDPVGRPDAIPAVVARAVELAERHGLSLGVVGAGEELLDLWRSAGLRTVYLGDEAIVDTAALSLEGRAVRKLRQSVTRLRKAGYTTELRAHEALAEAELAELEDVSGAWLDGDPERGFSMAMEGLRGTHHAGSMLLVARDPDGRVEGFLHFVPAHGRAAMSLGFMRRRPGTPNGLTEFLVVRAVEGLRDRGIEELSLNFCAFGRWLREPETFPQRMVGWIVPPFDRLFQIQSLLRFNAKFATRWAPRHVAFAGWASLPRVILAALEAEGQLPKPSLPAPLRRAAA